MYGRMENTERESETKYAVYAKQKEQEKVGALHCIIWSRGNHGLGGRICTKKAGIVGMMHMVTNGSGLGREEVLTRLA